MYGPKIEGKSSEYKALMAHVDRNYAWPGFVRNNERNLVKDALRRWLTPTQLSRLGEESLDGLDNVLERVSEERECATEFFRKYTTSGEEAEGLAHQLSDAMCQFQEKKVWLQVWRQEEARREETAYRTGGSVSKGL